MAEAAAAPVAPAAAQGMKSEGLLDKVDLGGMFKNLDVKALAQYVDWSGLFQEVLRQVSSGVQKK